MTDIQEIINKVRPRKGWFSDQQMRLLHPYISNYQGLNPLLVEIGTFHGRSTEFFALSNPSMNILTIDRAEEYEGLRISEKPPNHIDIDLLREHKIFQVLGDSLEISGLFNWPVDILFIDGNHEYEFVRADALSWIPKVREGGLIIFHDDDPQNWPGVTQTIDEVIKDWNLALAERTENVAILRATW
jgi:predicted O-methyltransferase YrrM